MASDQVIEEIKQRLDLVEYIGRAVDLKRAGRNYKACCPFHVEKTPSFIVFPHTQTWHCFGSCGEGGDLFSFLQKREGLAFGEALQQLAREAGVELEAQSERQQEARRSRDRLLALCDAGARQFQTWLRELDAAEGCRSYLVQRGISEEMIGRFGIGYAPDRWDALLGVLTERGYRPEDLAAVGLARLRDDGGFYDAFRGRLMLPIRDERGRVVGFGGRALGAEQTPKYINSPQTPLFDKGRLLYGLDLARERVRVAERAILVEGYLDVIAAHQHGYGETVATLGTALTSGQIALLARYTPNLVLALDGDAAGQRAAERALEAVLDHQTEARRRRRQAMQRGRSGRGVIEGDLRVVPLPEGKDPDDLIRQDQPEWERRLEQAQPVVDFLISVRLQGTDLSDPVQKARIAAEILPFVKGIESALVQGHYLQRLARLLRTDEDALRQEMAALPAPNRRARPDEGPPPLEPPAGYDDPLEPEEQDDPQRAPAVAPSGPPLEGYLLFLFLERPELMGWAQEAGLTSDMWSLTSHRQIYEALRERPPVSPAHLEEFAASLDRPVAARLAAIVEEHGALPAIDEETWEREGRDLLDQFVIAFLQRQIAHISSLLHDLAESPGAEQDELRTTQERMDDLERARRARQRAISARRERAVESTLTD